MIPSSAVRATSLQWHWRFWASVTETNSNSLQVHGHSGSYCVAAERHWSWECKPFIMSFPLKCWTVHDPCHPDLQKVSFLRTLSCLPMEVENLDAMIHFSLNFRSQGILLNSLALLPIWFSLAAFINSIAYNYKRTTFKSKWKFRRRGSEKWSLLSASVESGMTSA